MSLRDALSANLSRLCEGEQSIAAVCRSAKINRQQFNRYLSGDAIPNERNLGKICGYFGVSADDLFRAEAGGDRNAAAPRNWWSHLDFRDALKLVHSDARPSIAPGIFSVYFAVPQDRNTIVRSTMVVRNDGNLTTFRRLTGVSERKGSWWSQFFGDHKGIILERAHWLYMVGLNTRGGREPSLIVLRWLSGSRPMLGGQALVMGPVGPTATAVVIDPCRPGLKLRTALRASHAYSTDGADVEPIVLDALEEQAKSLADKTRRVDLTIKPFDPRPPGGATQ